MANSTEDGNRTATQELFYTKDYGTPENILHLTLALPLSITAFLGNALIIIALQKVSSLYLPSKLLLGCLACTDLGVGFVSHTLRSGLYLSPEHSKSCYYLSIIFYFTGIIFCGVSLLTMTAISVDRLLALLLGLRYRQVVTVRRVWALVVTLWLSCTSSAMIVFYSAFIALVIASTVLLLCIVISTFCYSKICFKFMVRGELQEGNITLTLQNGSEIEKADDYKYLGAWITTSEKDISVRKALDREASKRLSSVWDHPCHSNIACVSSEPQSNLYSSTDAERGQ